jgi:hypothetical protein
MAQGLEGRMTGHTPWREVRHKRPLTITLAGIPVPRGLVEEFADTVDEPTASTLRRALDNDTRILALERDDRARILAALDDPPAGLEPLRQTLQTSPQS